MEAIYAAVLTMMMTILIGVPVDADEDSPFFNAKEAYKKIVTAGVSEGASCEVLNSREGGDILGLYANKSVEDIKASFMDPVRLLNNPHHKAKHNANMSIDEMNKFIDQAKKSCAINKALFCNEDKKCEKCTEPVPIVPPAGQHLCKNMVVVRDAGEKDWTPSEPSKEKGANGDGWTLRPLDESVAFGVLIVSYSFSRVDLV